MTTWQDMMKLGRVSNLPTTWSNVLAAWVLASTAPLDTGFWFLLMGTSLFYLGGMFLNDAFDADIDAIERPCRPIPAGRVERQRVFQLGFVMLAGGVIFFALASHFHGSDRAFAAPLAGLALLGTIALYDYWHKNNPFGPIVMGLARFLVYVCCALVAVSSLPFKVLIGGLLLFLYIVGLTSVAKQENMTQLVNLSPLLLLVIPPVYGLLFAIFDNKIVIFFATLLLIWTGYSLRPLFRMGSGNIPHAVSGLIAGISLLDAQLIATQGEVRLAVAALLAFFSTRLLQRWVPGT